MRVIGYVRVSSEEQAKEGLSLALQAQKIEAYCNLNDYTLVSIIEDAGVSAKNITGRKGFQRALAMVTAADSDIGGLVCWKLDRCFRSTIDALTVAQEFRDKSKCLMSITEKLDTGSAMGEFFFSLMASLAQMERRLTGERTKVILQSKKSRGEFVGKPRFGYQPAGKTLQKNTHQQKVVTLIRDLSSQGLSYRCIAQRLNAESIPTKQAKCWSHKQISNILAKK